MILYFSIINVVITGLEDGDVSTVGPDLSRGLTVVSPAEDVSARTETVGQNEGVHNGHGAPVRGLVTRAEAGPGSLLAGRGEARLRGVVTGGAVGARGPGTRDTARPGLAAATQTPRGQRVHRPHGAGRLGPLRDEGPGDGQPGPVVPLESLLGHIKLERIVLETLLSELGLTGTQPVLISSPVVGRDLPGHLGPASSAPDGGGGEGREVRPLVSVYGVGRVHVFSPLRHVVAPGSSARQTTGVKSGGRARSSPGVVFVNIKVGPGLGSSVDRPVLGIVDSGHLAQPAEIYLDPPTDRVTGRAANTAALLVPVAGLPIVAPGLRLARPRHAAPGGVGADTGGGRGSVRPGQVLVYTIPAQGVDQGSVAPHGARQHLDTVTVQSSEMWQQLTPVAPEDREVSPAHQHQHWGNIPWTFPV